jgi:hypothetical protein
MISLTDAVADCEMFAGDKCGWRSQYIGLDLQVRDRFTVRAVFQSERVRRCEKRLSSSTPKKCAIFF